MQTVNELWQGYAPVVKTEGGNPEALKYGKLWATDDYRAFAPGEAFAQQFVLTAKPARGARVIDFGCGTGRGAARLAGYGLNVTMLDFVSNSLDAKVKAQVDAPDSSLHFLKADLEKPIPIAAEYGYCTDVMEHIPPDKVGVVLDNILKAAQHVWFSIALIDDSCGVLIGETLHLSVHPFAWWKEQFEKRDCKIAYAHDDDGVYAHFYVSAWQDGTDIVGHGVLNTEQQQIRANVEYNCAQGWTQAQPHESNDIECMILGGGPSMAAYEDEIRRNRADGVKLLTLNGAYNWAVHHGLMPSAQIVVDARPFNARFTRPVVEGCKYLISSQCDPSVFEGLPKERTFIWHTTAEMIQDILQLAYPLRWWAIPGGSTVLLRAIPLMRMLGYRKFILYGCDSCLTGEVHHAYEQKENDSELVLPVVVNPGGRVFHCHPWMISQAQEFLDLIRYLGEEIELDVRGDGLLSHILNVGAERAEIEEFKVS